MTALDDIEKAMRMLRDRGAEMQAFEGLLGEISTALSDILAVMEKPADQRAESQQMAQLIKAVTSMKPPDVNVNVQPSDWKSLQINIAPAGFDGSKKMTITKIK